MKIKYSLNRIIFCSLIFSIICTQYACNIGSDNGGGTTYVIMKTDLGEVILKLYDNTPLHKANFIKNTQAGIYDGVAFHRVIRDFMVQAGDPLTKDSQPEAQLPVYTLEAEIREEYVHTAGKLGAARKPDDINPERRSSAYQFFIVTGKPVTYTELEATNLSLNNSRRAALYQEFQELEPDPNADFDTFLESKSYEDKMYYDSDKIREYGRKGGAPHLDFQYTIFGEVLLGMEIIKQIEQIPTVGDRPQQIVQIQKVGIYSAEEYKKRNQKS